MPRHHGPTEQISRLEIIDYNGDGIWSREAIFDRYQRYCRESGIEPRDIAPLESVEGNRRWIYPVMERVIEGIEAGDAACIRLGVEFIHEDRSFPFGRVLKSNTARALRRAPLTDGQCDCIRRRVFAMLQAGNVPHEFREYAKLVRRIGFDLAEMGEVIGTSYRVARFRAYFETAARADSDP